MRVPLHFKAMVSYLVVVSLVFLPTFVYLRTTQQQELHTGLRRDLESELGAIARRLSQAPPDRHDELLELLVGIVPHRLTLIDPSGRVLVDSVGGSLENHADRPEVAAALSGPARPAFAERVSATTGGRMQYVAMRYPREGPPLGVLRLATPTATLDASEKRLSTFVSRAGAVALTAAMLFSLLAAFVVTRPLRRIQDAARAFASGDFGRPTDVRSNDELGDVAEALDDLASQLRGRLLAAGAERATLQALLDELPCGVVLYDPDGELLTLSSRARELCALTAAQEQVRARELLQLDAQQRVVEHVLRDGLAREVALDLPWQPEQSLRARWVALAATDGRRQPGLIVVEPADSALHARTLTRELSRCAALLHRALRHVPPGALANAMAEAARSAETLTPAELPDPAQIEPLALSDACHDVLEQLGASGHVDLALDDAQVQVVEAGGRVRRVLRSLVEGAVQSRPSGEPLVVRAESANGHVRVSVHTRRPLSLGSQAGVLRSLGGDWGTSREEEGVETWVLLPRA